MNSNSGASPFVYLSQRRGRLSTARILLLGLSFISLAICAYGAVSHYLKWHWGNPWQPVGWLLSMVFLLLAFSPQPRQVAIGLKSWLKPKTAFFVFLVLFFTFSHLWNFKTAPWNGNALFDESGWDLWFLKHNVIGHPFQAAWFHPPLISRETLFHYYLWSFFKVFGYNILSYEAGLFVIWCATFIFTLLLVDLLFRSNIVTALTALVFNFLPFAFIYTFAGYRYPMATALCVASLYFLHLGFRTASSFKLALGGMLAGLCLASSISGKQYLFALLIFGVLYAGLDWKTARRNVKLISVSIIAYGWLAAALPLLCYVVFNREAYTMYEASFVRAFWQAMTGLRPGAMTAYVEQLRKCFFSIPGPRFFIPDALPIPLPYYCFLLPGLVLALRQKRYEIALLAIIPVIGAFIATCIENRLLLPIPFWIILMAFTFAGLLKLKLRSSFKIPLWGASVLIVIWGLAPSIKYIYEKTKSPFSIYYFAQQEVAVSRFLRSVVAGRGPVNPSLEHDEFNRIKGIPDPPYETLICQREAYSIIHLFLHDYDDARILSFSDGMAFYVMAEGQVWIANKKAVAAYVPKGKNLKLIWERDPTTERIIKMFEPLRNLGTEETLSFSFAGRDRRFYVLNVGSENIRQFQERVGALPDSIL
jgi:hypothetical protein